MGYDVVDIAGAAPAAAAENGSSFPTATLDDDDDDDVVDNHPPPHRHQEDHIFRSKLPDIPIPNHLPLTDYCFQRLPDFAHKPCLLQSPSGPNYTYGEVELLSRRFAAGFMELGIGKGDVVMLLLPNCVEFVLLFLGLVRRGAAATTCNPYYTAQEISKQVKGSGARMVITKAAFKEKVREVEAMLQKKKQQEEGGKYENNHNSSHNGHSHSQSSSSSFFFRIMTVDEDDQEQEQEETSSSSSSSCDRGGGDCLHISTLMNADESRFRPADSDHHPDDLVALPYSSGTTGLPKGVMLTHRSLVTSIAQQVDGHNPNLYLTPSDIVLCVLPMFHIYSLNTVLLCSLRVGASIVVMTKFEIGALLDVIQRYRVTIAPLVPPIVLSLAKNPIVHNYDLSSIRVLMSGAAPLGKDLQAAFHSRVPHAVIGQGYGMTEAGPVLAISLAFAKDPFPAKPGACGTVVRNAEVKIVDPDTGVSLPHNVAGEICIRGAQIMKGYVGDAEATANTIDEQGFLHTGDIGYIDDDEEVFIVDRVKEIIKFKGFQVPPAELEAILLSHPAVLDAACVPKKDELAGEVPVAFIVRASDAAALAVDEAELKQFVAKQVVFYKKLHQVLFVDAIPKSPSGKILRKELRSRLDGGTTI